MRTTNTVRVAKRGEWAEYTIEQGSTKARELTANGGRVIDVDEARDTIARRVADGWHATTK